MATSILLPRRFRGPADSAQGGYAAGVAAALVGGRARVRLRRPPPVDRPLVVDEIGDGVVIRDGEDVVMEARPAPLELEVAVDAESLAAAFARGPAPPPESFPLATCFSCGANGLGIHPARLGDTSLWATVWTPRGEAGTVAPELTWGVLDCPGAWAAMGSTTKPGGAFAALAAITAEVARPVPVGRPVAVFGWMIAEDERRFTCGSAIIGGDGAVLASSLQSNAVLPLDWARSG